jgi:hypothetical protein
LAVVALVATMAAVIVLGVRQPRGWLVLALLLLTAVGVGLAVLAPGLGLPRVPRLR